MSASDLREWLRYAKDDLGAARLLDRHGAAAHLAAMHAQQCAEKAIKAVIVASGRAPRKTHDLATLVDDLNDAVPNLPPRDVVDRLTDHAVEARYSDDLPDVSPAQAEEAIETAAAVEQALADRR